MPDVTIERSWTDAHPLHLFTVEEAAQILGKSTSTLHRWMATNGVPYRVILGDRMFAKADIERIVRDGQRGPR
jgi:predicted DNA-binding transcriptional regulator AlpA